MKTYFKHFILAIVIAFPTLTLANVTEETIDHLGTVGLIADRLAEKLREEQVENLHKKIMIVFDWDRTVSKYEGVIDKDFLSEPEGQKEGPLLSTSELFQSLNTKGFAYFILTARGGGEKFSLSSIQPIISDMANAVDLSSPSMMRSEKIKTFSPVDNDSQQIGYLNWNSGDVTMITSHVVFAGSSYRALSLKALTLEQLIDRNYFETKPEHIIFVDNSYRHIKGFVEVFADRSENVFALYYPKHGDEDGIMQNNQPQSVDG